MRTPSKFDVEILGLFLNADEQKQSLLSGSSSGARGMDKVVGRRSAGLPACLVGSDSRVGTPPVARKAT